MMEIRKNYYPEDIALALCSIANPDFQNFDENGELNHEVEEIRDAVYYLMAVAENQYNRECYRKLWDVLQNITERFENKEI